MEEYKKGYANFLYKFSKIIKQVKLYEYSEIVFVCIGTSKVPGDSFGPLVGEKLKEKIKRDDVIILGDMKDNISALNVKNILKNSTKLYNNPLIISIDAALAKKEDIGKIHVYPHGIKIRRALDESEVSIGDIGIKGIVANNYKGSIENYIELTKTPLSRIELLSDLTANGINEVINNSNV